MKLITGWLLTLLFFALLFTGGWLAVQAMLCFVFAVILADITFYAASRLFSD